MAALWLRYGHPLRLSALACAAAFCCMTGVTVLVERTNYGYPGGQVALWAGCSALYLAATWRTRGPSWTSAVVLTVLLVANAVSAVDPRVGRGATAWAPNMIGAALTFVVFTGSVRRALVLLAASILSNGLLIVFRYETVVAGGATLARLVTGNVGMLIGVLPSMMIVLALRGYAQREIDQRRRTEAAEVARASVLAVRTDRRLMLEPAVHQARQVLAGLASGSDDPADPRVREACRSAEQRLRAALLAAVQESALATLAQQLLVAARSRVELVVQGGPAWDTLPENVRERVTELLHQVVDRPDTRRINLTVLPDEGRAWLSLTVDGGAAPEALPEVLSRPSARGRAGDQWWMEWTLPTTRPTREKGGQDIVATGDGPR